ncbi:hypothetical protein GCM10022226_75790 [Sphaerisporangium flaviroseum]|uniref:Uncharacterized protein n=1 Tax=Sphaerisporangium flaviroseum TaxID=509199 RepID=A0ABP7JEC2_9ACTN
MPMAAMATATPAASTTLFDEPEVGFVEPVPGASGGVAPGGTNGARSTTGPAAGRSALNALGAEVPSADVPSAEIPEGGVPGAPDTPAGGIPDIPDASVCGVDVAKLTAPGVEVTEGDGPGAETPDVEGVDVPSGEDGDGAPPVLDPLSEG